MLIPGILTAAIGLLLILAVIFRHCRCHTAVEAVVTRLTVKSVKLRGTSVKQYTPVVTYTFDSRDYTAPTQLTTAKADQYAVGQKMRAFIDPRHPETLRVGHSPGFLVCGIALTLLGAAVILLSLV